MRVLHIINGLGPGGAEALLYRLVTAPSEIEHRVIVLGRQDTYSKQLEERGIAVRHLGLETSLANIGGVFRLWRAIRDADPDVVQAWMYRSNLLGGIAARLAGAPVVWGIHCSDLGSLGLASRVTARATGLLAGMVPNLIVNCSVRSSQLHAGIGYPPERCIVIHNGYDPSVFHPSDETREPVRAALGIEPGTFLIGSIARWHPQKGIPLLLEAVRRVRQRGLPLKCLLVGRDLADGNPELGRVVEQQGCAEDVLVLGERSDIPALAGALDLHVLASIGSEAFPNVIAETMLAGTPNVATDVGDSALMVGDTGWVIEPGNVRRLAEEIEQAAIEWRHQPARWATRRRAARERIAGNYTFDRMRTAYERAWQEIASRRPPQVST